MADGLGALVRARREQAGLTQRQLAGRAGIGIGTLEDIEQSRTQRPRRRSLTRLAMALGLDPGQLAELASPPLGAANRARVLPGRPPQGGPAPASAASADCRLRMEVLGPLEVRRDGRPVALGPARRRAVLGLIALHPGMGLPRAALVDALWGERPPPTAATMVQAQVSQIRGVLGPGRGTADTQLSWDGFRYRLSLAGIGLDLAEFNELAGRAQQAVAEGNAGAGCALFERALGQWRGQPLVDIEILGSHPAVTALARRRDDVVIEYAAAAFRAGAPGQVVTHLEALTARQPLDERAHAQLMNALAASGQQAAALRLYQELVRRLDNELGVRPGTELAAAHMQVLRQQVPAASAVRAAPSLTGGNTPCPAGAAAPSPALGSHGGHSRAVADRVVPRQLPPAVAGFAGRATELAELTRLLEQATGAGRTVVISAIGGTAGVGKTALAVYWAHQAVGRFPDGQLYVNLRGFGPSCTPMTSVEAVRLFLDGLGVAPGRIPPDPQAQAGLYRSLLAGKRMLLVLDNARDPGQVRPLLPGTPGCLVLVTSRNQLTGLAASDAAHLITLGVLAETEARDLLAQRLGTTRAAEEPAAMAGLAQLCAGLPLALGVAAARAASRSGLPLAALAAELRETQPPLDALATGDAATDVRTVFSWSCQHLGTPAARMFALLGLHPGPDVSVPAAASLAGLPPGQARQAMADLASASLATEHAPGRYTLHDLLRAYAAEQAATLPERQRRVATHRMLDHYLHTANLASSLMHSHCNPLTLEPPQPGVLPEKLAGPPQAMDWFRAEHQVLLAVTSRAAALGGFATHAWQLPCAMATFLNWGGYWRQLAATQESALAAASGAGDRTGQAEAHRFLGMAQVRLGAFAKSSHHLRAALELGCQGGSNLFRARVHADLSWARGLQGRDREALGHAEQSVRLYCAAGDQPGEAMALNLVGWYCARLGRYRETLRHCGQALALHRELGDRLGKATTLDSLGYAYHHLGDHAEAIICYEKAIEAFGGVADLHMRAESLTHLGDAHQAGGDTSAARHAWRQALAILDDLHHPDAERVRARLAGVPAENGASANGGGPTGPGTEKVSP
ncbi:MAG TPA: BTAD domain-containing putative transcriptional regulator [Streptosporangiaceae bacterium]|nr:BTAD domain-containing putative transcriptional regulator [Streptosporangiaceae bacterium]